MLQSKGTWAGFWISGGFHTLENSREHLGTLGLGCMALVGLLACLGVASFNVGCLQSELWGWDSDSLSVGVLIGWGRFEEDDWVPSTLWAGSSLWWGFWEILFTLTVLIA